MLFDKLRMIIAAAVTVAVIAVPAVCLDDVSDAASYADVEIETVSASAGSDDVAVRVIMSSNPGIWFLQADIQYDDRITLVDVIEGDVIGMEMSLVEEKPFSIYCEETSLEDNTKTGTILTLVFSIPDDSTGEYAIEFAETDAANVEEEEVIINAYDGFIVVKADSTVTFDEDGGSEKIKPRVVPSNTEIVLPDYTGEKSGFVYVGWETGGKSYLPGERYTVTKDVVFKAVWQEFVHVEQVFLDRSSLTLEVGGTDVLTSDVYPVNATDPSVIWASSNTGVATVKDGKVTAISTGTARISVTTVDGNKMAFCSVTVDSAVIRVEGITIDISEKSIGIGDSFTITATVIPSDATDKTVNWTSTDDNIVRVDRTGKVLGISSGSASVIAATADGGFSAVCRVNVVVPVTGVSLDRDSLALGVGEIVRLTASVVPSNATNREVTWSSSNSSVAKVDPNGNVTGVSAGKADISVVTSDGGYKATCAVTVESSGGGGSGSDIVLPAVAIAAIIIIILAALLFFRQKQI